MHNFLLSGIFLCVVQNALLVGMGGAREGFAKLSIADADGQAADAPQAVDPFEKTLTCLSALPAFVQEKILKYAYPLRKLTPPCKMFTGHIDGVYSVAFNHDGSRLASGSRDCMVRIWNPAVDTDQCERILSGHRGWVRSVAFNHDGSRLASGSSDRTVRVWNPAVDTDQCERILSGHAGWVNLVAFNHDGSRLASGSSDNTVRIWNSAVDTNQCERILSGHAGAVLSVAFNHDGSRLASGLGDNTVRIWDLAWDPDAIYLHAGASAQQMRLLVMLYARLHHRLKDDSHDMTNQEKICALQELKTVRKSKFTPEQQQHIYRLLQLKKG